MGGKCPSAPVSIRSGTSGMIVPFCGLRRRAVRTGAGGTKSRSSYGGIFAFHDLHCEIGCLFGPQEVWSVNREGRQFFDAGNDDVHLCALGKFHCFRQFDFAPVDDCFVSDYLHRD
jgi:hypothetical protein